MFANMASFSVEVIEAENPLEVLDYEFACPDTGGAGRFRGGMAQRKTWRMLADEGILQVRADRQAFRLPWFGRRWTRGVRTQRP